LYCPGQSTRHAVRSAATAVALWLAASIAPAALAQAPATAPAAEPATLNPEADNNEFVAQYTQTLFSGRSPAEREEAARRLLSRQVQKDRAPVHRALSDAANRDAQFAAARALGDDPIPQPQLIAPLADLLGVSEAMTEAAAAALLNYRDEQALRRWTDFVVARDPTVARPFRVAAVRAARLSVDRTVVLTLIDLLANDRDAAIRDAAADALNELSGQSTRNGRDPALWRQWLGARAAEGAPADAVRTDLLERQRRRRSAPPPDLDATLYRLVQLSPDASKPEAVKRMLASPDPMLRGAGLRVYFQMVRQSGVVLFDKAVLRDYVHDSSPDVRQEAARVLAGLNDQGAVRDVLAQLYADPDPAVRAELCASLARFQDTRAVPKLLDLAGNDPSLTVSVAAARALTAMGPRIAADQGLRAATVGALTRAMALPRAAADASGELRAAYLEALATVADAQLRGLFIGNLNAQQPRVRRAAVAGLGTLGDPQTANAVLNVLRNDPEPDVRTAAVAAMERVASFAGFAGEVYRYTLPGPNGEPDERVRQRAWQAFVALARTANEDELTGWIDQIARGGPADAVDRQVTLLGVKLTRQLDPQKPNPRGAAITREALGEAQMSRTPPQPVQAVPLFRDALAYWRQNNGAPPTITSLSRSLVRAQLAAGQYADAAASTEAARDDQNTQQLLLADLTNEAERLLQKRPDDARRLADLTLKTVVTVTEPARGRLTRVRDAVPGNPR
jgi:HEAT repeat protein